MQLRLFCLLHNTHVTWRNILKHFELRIRPLLNFFLFRNFDLKFGREPHVGGWIPRVWNHVLKALKLNGRSRNCRILGVRVIAINLKHAFNCLKNFLVGQVFLKNSDYGHSPSWDKHLLLSTLSQNNALNLCRKYFISTLRHNNKLVNQLILRIPNYERAGRDGTM